jgi:hypothetical protein
MYPEHETDIIPIPLTPHQLDWSKWMVNRSNGQERYWGVISHSTVYEWNNLLNSSFPESYLCAMKIRAILDSVSEAILLA